MNLPSCGRMQRKNRWLLLPRRETGGWAREGGKWICTPCTLRDLFEFWIGSMYYLLNCTILGGKKQSKKHCTYSSILKWAFLVQSWSLPVKGFRLGEMSASFISLSFKKHLLGSLLKEWGGDTPLQGSRSSGPTLNRHLCFLFLSLPLSPCSLTVISLFSLPPPPLLLLFPL